MRHLLFIIMLVVACQVQAQRPGDVLHECRNATETQQRMSHYFTAQSIPDNVFHRMKGRSFGKNCTVKRSELRYLLVLHRNAEGKTQVGEMVCNKAIASRLLTIFRELYEANYRIGRMVLIDDYNADDERSMAANNTTCFNFRFMTGSRTRVSKHGMGMAVDINPLYNPYVKGNRVQPTEGRKYIKNRATVPMAIQRGDLCYSLFIKHGFRWGGAWRTLKDYQHFEF